MRYYSRLAIRRARRKDALVREVTGAYVRPSYNAFYTLLRHRSKKMGKKGKSGRDARKAYGKPTKEVA